MSETVALERPLPVGGVGTHGSGWWGLLAMLVTEACLFGYLLFAYFYLAAQSTAVWPPEGPPDLRMPIVATLLLLFSSVLVWLGERCVRRGSLRWAIVWLLGGLGCGGVFALIQVGEWQKKPFGLTSHTYGSLYFTITGFHLVHVIVGLAILALLVLWAGLGYFDANRHGAVRIGAMYWHFVDAVWLFVFTALYLTPYLFARHA